MKSKSKSFHLLSAILYALMGAAVMTACAIGCNGNPQIAGLILVAFAIANYFGIVFLLAKRNWMDVRALFGGVWVATIGLAVMRLAEYQEPWQTKTWVLSIAAYFLFLVSATLGRGIGSTLYARVSAAVGKIRLGRIRMRYQPQRLYWICVITTLIGLTCFVINICIKGYLPCFSEDTSAYVNFYTKFHVFAVASTIVSGLCFYCLRTQKLSWPRRIVLVLCILYLVFLFPVMVVSRGVFMVTALSLVTAVFYSCGKRLWVLCLSVVVIMSVYMGVSTLRNYSDGQLNEFFEPAEIPLPIQPGETTDPSGSETDPTATEPSSGDPSQDPDEKPATFVLSPKMAFLYSYLTVSHDNFNLAVKNATGYSWGARQLIPFNVILRSDAIEKAADGEWYQVNPYLNTANLFGGAYYDFHEYGVVILCLLWAFSFGLIQGFAEQSGGAFSLLVLGNAMTPVALCFFASWMSNFTLWMHWGVVLLLGIVSCLTLNKSPQGEEEAS